MGGRELLTVAAAGRNEAGQCGVPPQPAAKCIRAPVPAPGLRVPGCAAPRKLALGQEFTAVLTDQGVYAAGCNDCGQLGRGAAGRAPHPELAEVRLPRAAADIACGASHLVAVLVDGVVWTCGWNAFLQCGRGPPCGELPSPGPVPSVGGAARCFAGAYCTLVQCSGGEMWGFGDNSLGQLCLGGCGGSEPPRRIAALSGLALRDMQLGQYHGIALLEDASVLLWGDLDGRLADGSAAWEEAAGCVPIQLAAGGALLRCLAAAAGWTHCAAVSADGTLWVWGRGDSGQLGFADAASVPRPTPLPLLCGGAACGAVCGARATFVRSAGGLRAAAGAGCVVLTGPSAWHVLYLGGPVAAELAPASWGAAPTQPPGGSPSQALGGSPPRRAGSSGARNPPAPDTSPTRAAAEPAPRPTQQPAAAPAEQAPGASTPSAPRPRTPPGPRASRTPSPSHTARGAGAPPAAGPDMDLRPPQTGAPLPTPAAPTVEPFPECSPDGGPRPTESIELCEIRAMLAESGRALAERDIEIEVRDCAIRERDREIGATRRRLVRLTAELRKAQERARRAGRWRPMSAPRWPASSGRASTTPGPGAYSPGARAVAPHRGPSAAQSQKQSRRSLTLAVRLKAELAQARAAGEAAGAGAAPVPTPGGRLQRPD